jgi:hypothetical protein
MCALGIPWGSVAPGRIPHTDALFADRNTVDLVFEGGKRLNERAKGLS